jgi:hypothetical protein
MTPKPPLYFAAVKGLGQHSIRPSRYHSRLGKLTFEGSSKRWADTAVERAQWCYEAFSCEPGSPHASSICLPVREKRADEGTRTADLRSHYE